MRNALVVVLLVLGLAAAGYAAFGPDKARSDAKSGGPPVCQTCGAFVPQCAPHSATQVRHWGPRARRRTARCILRAGRSNESDWKHITGSNFYKCARDAGFVAVGGGVGGIVTRAAARAVAGGVIGGSLTACLKVFS